MPSKITSFKKINSNEYPKNIKKIKSENKIDVYKLNYFDLSHYGVLETNNKNRKLIIYNQGHGGNPYDFEYFNIINSHYKKRGYDIFSLSMSLIGYNETKSFAFPGIKKLKNSNDISITSKYGKYNSGNFDTIFSKNVLINYLNNEIAGEYLDFSLERNLLLISKKVVYKNLENILKADAIEMNIKTKDTKIFMYENQNKVSIKSIN